MKRIISNMSSCEGLDVVVNNGVIDPEYVPSETDMDNILREIFSVDERSGFPAGDIAYYLSPNGNPQVKQWLENNLIRPRGSSGSTIEGLTDDLIAECQRRNGESVHDYAFRMEQIRNEAIEFINKNKVPANE